MIFREIAFGSEEYERERLLRDEVLWGPRGLSLKNADLSQERNQFHYGLFTPDDSLAACAVALPLSATEAKIRQVAVSPAHQKQGLGRQLMNAAEEHLQNNGFTRFMLHAQVPAVGFYEKLGYAVISEEFLEANTPHRKMEKRIV